MNPKQLLALTLETLLNQVIQLDALSLQHLAKLSDKTIHIELRGLNLDFFVFPRSEGLIIQSESEKVADTTVSGAPFSLMMLFFNKQALPANSDVEIHGEIGVVHTLSEILRELHIDWEEQLSRILGDIPAHKINNLVNNAREYAQERWHNLHRNSSEYLQEEIRLLPAASEIIFFMNQVDQLRDDIERLDKRVQRLYSRI